jgi:hypothetical protein
MRTRCGTQESFACNRDLCWKSKFKLGDLMGEQRKLAIPFATTLLCGRKLIETMESDKPNFAQELYRCHGSFVW